MADVPSCWCDAPDPRPLAAWTLPGGTAVSMVRCARCGVHALRPPPDDAVLARAYAADYYGASARKFVGPIARGVAWFQEGRARQATRLLPPGGRVLDVGCGNGGFLAALARRGFRVEGTERTADGAARVPEGIPVHVGDLVDLALPAATYDLVTLWHVFEHLRRPDAALARIRTLLRPGGTLLMAVPNAGSWQARLFRRHWFHHDPPRHLWAFDPPSLLALLCRAGFTGRVLGTWSLEQNPFGVAQSTLNAAGFPRDRAYDVLKGVATASRGTRALDAVLLAALAPVGVALSVAESMVGRGGTVVVSARPEGE
ncbi:MAG: class I SAM-dependent methyltransferase [bacterium]|nr:class I SAM-dependent methyltransferase [bacterium]